MRTSYSTLWFWLGLILPGSALWAGVTMKATPYPNACLDVRLPRWKNPEVPFSSWMEWGDCDYEFRATDGGVLVGLYCGTWPKEKRVESPDHYAILFSTRKVQRATPSEWDQADPFLLTRITTGPRGKHLEAGQKVKYKGQEFDKIGANWPQDFDPSLVSPNGNLLAVNSWDGTLDYPGDPLALFQRNHFDGHYYVDLYQAASGQRLLTLKGEFHGVDPHELFRMAAWISPNYYLLPLDAENLRRFALCDLRRVPVAAEHR